MANFEQCKRCYHDFSYCGHYDGDESALCNNYAPPVDNTKMFNSFFTWKGRYNRMQFLCAILISVALYFILIFATLPAQLLLMTLTPWPELNIVIYSIIIALIPSYILGVSGMKRTHDAGLPPIWGWVPVIAFWWANIVFILAACFCLFYLFKEKGVEGVNDHGSNPSEPYHSQLDFE